MRHHVSYMLLDEERLKRPKIRGADEQHGLAQVTHSGTLDETGITIGLLVPLPVVAENEPAHST